MNRRCTGVYGRWLAAAACAVLAACQANSTRAPAADRAPAAKPQFLMDASYDWHVLLIAPFGSVLKDIPVPLHEVLLFRDEARGTAAADDAECYAPDQTAPQFVGHTPDEYLLCFKQDRLTRIQASVRLDTAQAPEVFAAACAGWLERAVASVPPVPGASAPSAAPTPAADSCEGREGSTRFSAHLGEEPESNLSIVLDRVSDP